jgi:hypothetical protein
VAPDKTVTKGTNNTAHFVVNPDYVWWWTKDKKILGCSSPFRGVDNPRHV